MQQLRQKKQNSIK